MWIFSERVLFFLFFVQIYGQSDNSSDCECVPFYLCENGTIITNGKGIIDVRFKQECTNYLDVCCKKSNIVQISKTQAVPSTTLLGCGYRNTDGVGFRILGDDDNEAQFGEFPWMVAVFIKKENEHKHLYKCGGSLIHPQVVLTAAHCIIGGQKFKIRVGEWDSQTNEEILRHQDKTVSSAVIHQNYNRKNLANDIALLFLDSPVTLASHINTVCLPPPNKLVESNACIVSGWGRDRFEDNRGYQNILKKIELPILNHQQCQKDFRKTRLGKFFRLDKSFICAGGEEGKDACTGDGGGPLICPIEGEEDRYQQVGIVSWGIGCGTRGIPGAYTNVIHLRTWIDEQMKNNNFNSTYYNF